MLSPLILTAVVALSSPPAAHGCTVSPATTKVLESLQVPPDAHLSSAATNEQRVALVKKALATSPRDVALHEAYQKLRLEPIDADRPALVGEYDALLQKNPRDPAFLYLAARAKFEYRTKEAIANLQASLAVDPGFAPAHLLLAEIHATQVFQDQAEVVKHADAFAEACPGSVRAFNSLAWNKDRDLVSRVAARLRKNVATRTDSEAVQAYPLLWRLEEAMERSDHQEENRARLRKDIERLYAAGFVRNAAWKSALDGVTYIDESQDQSDRARKEVAAAYPASRVALAHKLLAASTRPPGETGTEERSTAWRRQWKAGLPLTAQYPEAQWLAATVARFAVLDPDATASEMEQAVTPFLTVLLHQPVESWSSPPVPASIAERLVARKAGYHQAREFGILALKASESQTAPERTNDTRPESTESNRNVLEAWQLYTYYPLGEAYARLGRLAEAKGILLKYEALLDRRRPASDASSQDKLRFAEDEARFWQLRGLVAEAEGHPMDALIAYRNAITTYPPRRPAGDRRDEAMSAAEQIWRQQGGTTQGWTDWARTSVLTNFHSGSGEGNAWGRLAATSPTLVFTDTFGTRWQAKDLAAKTVFMTMWASWCGPCRAELPYVEKLYERFKGRQDVVILAMNVDDDPKAMETALSELKLRVPSVPARDFIYTVVPQMALPSNWLFTPKTTELLWDGAPTLDAWMENVAKAIEKAAATK